MRQLVSPIGYGQTTSQELDDFSRIRLGHFRDNEEVRYDRPTSFSGTKFEYIGVAASGTSVTTPTWTCIRCTWVNGQKTREQFKTGASWIDRELLWED